MPSTFDKKTGKLTRFAGGTTEVLAAWPSPLGWRKGPGDPCWRHVRPSIRLPGGNINLAIERFWRRYRADFPYRINATDDQIKAEVSRGDRLHFLLWAQRIPCEVRRLIARFPDRQWHLLSMVARCGKPALDLVESNPALSFALASSWVFRKYPVSQPMRSIRSLLRPRRKQREIQSWLGFPASSAVRRILASVVPKSCTIERLLYLRNSCHDPEALKALGHQGRINASVIRILTDPLLREHAHFRLLKEISNDRREDKLPRSAWLLQDLIRMCDMAGEPLPRISDPEELRDLHDAQADRFWEEPGSMRLDDLNMEFPQPPLKPAPGIEPITSITELQKEGQEMRHCVWSYGQDIAVRKNTFVYRVLQPERATLSLVRHGDRWKIGQLQGQRNSPVSPTVWKSVGEWLKSHGEGAARTGPD